MKVEERRTEGREQEVRMQRACHRPALQPLSLSTSWHEGEETITPKEERWSSGRADMLKIKHRGGKGCLQFSEMRFKAEVIVWQPSQRNSVSL